MKQNRHINKLAVIGSGIMGSRIACHFANIGVDVLLLDIVPFDLSEEQLKNQIIRNSIVNDALKSTLKSNPSPIYSKEFVNRITTGNLDDDLHKIANVSSDAAPNLGPGGSSHKSLTRGPRLSPNLGPNRSSAPSLY